MARQALVEQSIAEIPGVELQNLHIYCLGQRTFLIGDVQSSDQANAILLAADRVSSEHTVEGYLPLQSTQTHKSGDVTAKTAIQKQLVDQLGIGVAHEIDVWVMAGQAILVGFGDYKQAQIAVNIAKSTPGIDGVTNFIVLPTLANN